MPKKLLITGGGTGGHLAVAEALLGACARAGWAATYVGSTSGMDARWFSAAGSTGAAKTGGGAAEASSAAKKGAYIRITRANTEQKLTNDDFIDFAAYFLPSKGFVHCGKIEQIKALICLCTSTLRALFILLRERPDAIIAVGGYSALPAALAAVILRRPLFLHEQNSRMGLANRLLARLCKRVFCAFVSTGGAEIRDNGNDCLEKSSDRASVDFQNQTGGAEIGNKKAAEQLQDLCAKLGKLGLLRLLSSEDGGADFAAAYAPYPLRSDLSAARRKRTKVNNLLILGGSAGAAALNELAISLAPGLFARKITLLHQCGRANFAAVRAAYVAANIPAFCLDERLRPLAPARFFATPAAHPVTAAPAARSRICTPPLCANYLPASRAKAYLIAFCADMQGLYSCADFAISRAGASALSELLAAAVPALFVPYPFAASDHQRYNAQNASHQGFALLCDQQDPALFEAILPLLGSDICALLNARLLSRCEANGADLILEEIHGLLG